MVRIVGALIDFQHIFHCRYECAVRLWWDDPLLLDVGFENVFLELARWCCRWPCPQCSVPQPSPPTTVMSTGHAPWEVRNGAEQANAMSFASFSPSKICGTAGVARCLRLR